MIRSTRSRKALTATAALALTFTMAACSESDSGSGASGDGGESVSGSIKGMGASSQQAAVEKWKADFETANGGATVNYDPQGSGAGREQFAAGAVDFAGTDSAFEEEELDKAKKVCGGDIVQIPVYVSPIAIAYNLEGVDKLQLKPATVAEIFDGKIKTWNDPKIKADNPDADLPSTKITTVHRSDDSGTSKNFSDYLGKAAEKSWTHEAEDAWPVKGGTAAKGTSGVVDAIGKGDGTIGYADLSQVGELKTVALGVGDEYVEPTAESAAKILDASKAKSESETDLAVDVAKDTEEAGVYPNVLVSYQVGCLKYDDAAKAKVVKAWLNYVTGEEGQKASAEAAGSAELPAEWVKKNTAAVEKIS
ncbi:phosphate ABC transporter substrate-binding protein PstS [Janibacter sp. CX7]|uniref:phosphate ABC transporter substrate-binding protein PstS n=1 Tax=Janibacter sp. CX7 TaxID=2963431 RepID=UPI0020CE3C65|nr:phosphate ABC transporter substrate-binding protein PstS [Janibacter sp. CX7]UTT66401.1 phosphate ABC transporter substrate-binding protein PstS [Janibacter sp. CX7]